MLRSETLFGKRETPTPNSPLSASNSLSSNSPSSFPKPGSQNISSGNSGLSSQNANISSTTEGGSKLIVGPNIKLKGVEITDCDTLVVEGRVEATMNSRVIHIAEKGTFKGSAEIDKAEIHGNFEGNLTVRETLIIHATGVVTGKIRYGKLVVEEGGQLVGEVQVGGKPAAVVAPPVAVAASTSV
ncbi:polymer-forming cytoskeletal protein [Glaciimonas sp. PCH181]|uniref:bactofilin family protein n=1 Tax=Glaciimonas sp. PCH181 TaxID=2133943 RepID=UPI000D33D6F5|nr:polymer-forming cytoskeletal protein [Glaciimonas sp. PCH181]PUA20140.1 cell shape determination protein CcmA [Glaciimonas sp. PCH181]